MFNSSVKTTGRVGDQLVSVLAFFSYNPSSNPAEAFSLFRKICIKKNENKRKEARVGPFLKNCEDHLDIQTFWTSIQKILVGLEVANSLKQIEI